MQLGHTLITECHDAFYSARLCLGCAIGSVYVATEGEAGELPPPLAAYDYIPWLREKHPWTTAPAFGALNARLTEVIKCDPSERYYGDEGDYAFAISVLHAQGVPRMEIAQLIQLDEPVETRADSAEQSDLAKVETA